MANLQNSVPIDQHHLPREQRQHPFRWATEAEREEVRREADAAIAGVHAALIKFARRSAPRASQHDLADIVQDVRLELFSKSLPNYDAWRKPAVKVSTYLYGCIWRATYQLSQRAIRQQKARGRHHTLNDAPEASLAAPDCFDDRRVEALAEAILSDPELLAGPRTAGTATGIIRQPLGEADRTTSARLGISLSMFQSRRFDVREKAVALLDAA